MDLSLGTNIIIISIVFAVLSTIAVLLRFLARSKHRLGFSIDDFFIAPGLLFSVGLCINNIVAVTQGGLGSHIHLDPKGNIILDNSLRIFLQVRVPTPCPIQ
ncbi:hypothetical protein F4808DRAFT_444503 [Astrocystis sublimbata]|nr:hypothetical protein F4808DRAFT_444503 [Astrocystis sublimbata]